MIAALAGLSLFVAPLPGPQVRLEVDPSGERYRAVIETPRPLSFRAAALHKPSGSLSPGLFSIEVMDRAGKPIPCPGGSGGFADGRYRSSTMSSDIFPVRKHVPTIRVRSEFATEWFETRSLFSGFHLCHAARDLTQWGSYRIHVVMRTSAGTLTTESGWLAVPKRSE